MKKIVIMFRANLILLTGSLSVSPMASNAASLLLNSTGGWNGFSLEAEIEAGYRPAGGPSGVKELSNSDSGFLSLAPDVHAASETVSLVSNSTGSPLNVNFLPDSGNAKDKAEGSMDVTFTVGTITAADSFNFSFLSTTSAEASQMDFGTGLESADAFFRATISLQSSYPTIVPGAQFRVPDLPALSDPSTESLTAVLDFFEAGTPASGFFSPGGSGLLVPLELAAPGERFSYVLTYEITTPFGTDPTYEYSITGGTQIPEPNYSALPAILALACFRRRISR